MILRSIGKTLKVNSNQKSIKDYKIRLFQELDKLTLKLDQGQLDEPDIINSIQSLVDEFDISFGQAQKAVNVILKYHFHLFNGENKDIKSVLHCPLDSVILKHLFAGEKISLTDIDRALYIIIQRLIEKKGETKIDFDINWDIQHLKDEGIL